MKRPRDDDEPGSTGCEDLDAVFAEYEIPFPAEVPRTLPKISASRTHVVKVCRVEDGDAAKMAAKANLLDHAKAEKLAYESCAQVTEELPLLPVIERPVSFREIRHGDDGYQVIVMRRFGCSILDWMRMPPQVAEVTTKAATAPAAMIPCGFAHLILSKSADHRRIANEMLRSVIFQLVLVLRQLRAHVGMRHGDLHGQQVLFGPIDEFYTNRCVQNIEGTQVVLQHGIHVPIRLIDLEHATVFSKTGFVDAYLISIGSAFELRRFCTSLMFSGCLQHSDVWAVLSPDIKEFFLEASGIRDPGIGKGERIFGAPPPEWASQLPIGGVSLESLSESRMICSFRRTNGLPVTKLADEFEFFYAGHVPPSDSAFAALDGILTAPVHETVSEALKPKIESLAPMHILEQLVALRLNSLKRTNRFVESAVARLPGVSQSYIALRTFIEAIFSERAFLLAAVLSEMWTASRKPLHALVYAANAYVRRRLVNGRWDAIMLRDSSTNLYRWQAVGACPDIENDELNLALDFIRFHDESGNLTKQIETLAHPVLRHSARIHDLLSRSPQHAIYFIANSLHGPQPLVDCF